MRYPLTQNTHSTIGALLHLIIKLACYALCMPSGQFPPCPEKHYNLRCSILNIGPVWGPLYPDMN